MAVAASLERAPAAGRRAGSLRLLRSRVSRDPTSAAGAVFLIVVALLALLAPVLSPHDPYAIVDRPLRPTGEGTLLGTDDVGRDLLSRLLHGARVTLAVGIGAALLTAGIGTIVGALAGFYGGRTDTALSGLVNVVLSVPALPLALVIGAFVEMSLPILIVVIGGVSWTGTARIVRAETLSLREREFVASARALGASDGGSSSGTSCATPCRRSSSPPPCRSRPRSSRNRRSRTSATASSRQCRRGATCCRTRSATCAERRSSPSTPGCSSR